MVIEKRNNCCPKCGYKLLAREDDEIICLNLSCDWRILSKRVDDLRVANFQELKEMFNE